MKIQFLIFFVICNLVHRCVMGNVTFYETSIAASCFAEENTWMLPVTISNSNNLAEELKTNPYLEGHTPGCIGINEQRIPVIYKGALSNIHLKGVKIDRCGITEIQPGSMQNASIKVLSITHNKIETIKRDAFKGVSDMEELDLTYNRIKFIENGTLENVPLKKLDLSQNELEAAPFGTFKNVSVLWLSNNKIKQIPKGPFSDSALAEIYLQENSIENIEAGAFENTPNLTIIRLFRNKLTKVSSGIFNGFSGSSWRLEFLDLSRNSIKHIEAGAFVDSSIKVLLLDLNKVTEIKNDTFGGSRIRSLYLGGNEVTSIEVGAFNLEGLEELILTYNNLTIIRKGTFRTPNISHVELAPSNIRVIEPEAFNPISIKQIDVQTKKLDEDSKAYINSLHVKNDGDLYS